MQAHVNLYKFRTVHDGILMSPDWGLHGPLEPSRQVQANLIVSKERMRRPRAVEANPNAGRNIILLFHLFLILFSYFMGIFK